MNDNDIVFSMQIITTFSFVFFRTLYISAINFNLIS